MLRLFVRLAAPRSAHQAEQGQVGRISGAVSELLRRQAVTLDAQGVPVEGQPAKEDAALVAIFWLPKSRVLGLGH